MNLECIKKSIRDIPDFPRPGIVFKDVSTVFKDPEAIKYVVDELSCYYKNFGITKVVGIESRGFILGSAIACYLGAGFVPVRKLGKLPAETYSESYELEYGKSVIEMHIDALSPDDIVLVHDDLMATGGTIGAAINLVKKNGVKNIFANVFIELSFFKGRSKIGKDVPFYSLVEY